MENLYQFMGIALFCSENILLIYVDLDERSAFALEANLTLAKFAILHQKSLSMSQGWQDFLSAKSMLVGLLSENTEVMNYCVYC